MKYKSTQDILPKHVLELLQEYVDGEYLYIPLKNNSKKSWGKKSWIKKNYKKEIEKFLIIINKE